MPTMEELSKTTDRLTVDHLRVILRGLSEAPPPVNADADFLTYGLAAEVLRFFYGNTWTNQHAFSIHKKVAGNRRKDRSYLKTDSEEPDQRFRHMERVKGLAEMAFNLQGTEGFRQRLEEMKKNDLQDAMGEFYCAELVSAPELKFRFVKAKNVRGEDYDGEVFTKGNTKVCCEIKTKGEQTALSENTIRATIKGSKDQWPEGARGILFIRVPEEWTKVPGAEETVSAAINDQLRQTKRIAAIVLLWEEWHSSSLGQHVIHMFRSFPNKNSDVCDSEVDEVISKLGRSRSWITFRELAEQILREARDVPRPSPETPPT